jgi:hypothetical protein
MSMRTTNDPSRRTLWGAAVLAMSGFACGIVSAQSQHIVSITKYEKFFPENRHSDYDVQWTFQMSTPVPGSPAAVYVGEPGYGTYGWWLQGPYQFTRSGLHEGDGVTTFDFKLPSTTNISATFRTSPAVKRSQDGLWTVKGRGVAAVRVESHDDLTGAGAAFGAAAAQAQTLGDLAYDAKKACACGEPAPLGLTLVTSLLGITFTPLLNEGTTGVQRDVQTDERYWGKSVIGVQVDNNVGSLLKATEGSLRGSWGESYSTAEASHKLDFTGNTRVSFRGVEKTASFFVTLEARSDPDLASAGAMRQVQTDGTGDTYVDVSSSGSVSRSLGHEVRMERISTDLAPVQ